MRLGSVPNAMGQSGVELTIGQGDVLRLFAGQPEPHDSARFTIRYALNGSEGTIDGLLDNEYWATLKVRDGPLLERSDQWSYYEEATGR
jgi:hypothetical protein